MNISESQSSAESVPDPDRYEQFTTLLVKHHADFCAYINVISPRGTDCEEMAQIASLVAWRKFSQFKTSTGFLRWICQIAKFEMMNDLRKRRRDPLRFNDELLDLIADETMEEHEALTMERAALGACLDRLSKPVRELLLRCYAPRANLAEIARAAGRSGNSLYKWLNRIRRLLLDCISRNLMPKGCT